MELVDRHAECGVLDRLIEAVRTGESRALVVSGEAGVGKTALLEHLAGQASECRLARIAGVQSEMELPFAALHQLCAPMLEKLQGLPAPQRDALEIALGMSSGSAPDRFLVGLAVLSLLSDTAEQQPLVCLVDDEQWLDRASAQVLGFAARRLGAESVGLVFAARAPSNELAGLPNLVVERLGETDARTLLDAALTGPLDSRVRDQILAETRGNPLALLELPRGLTPQELAGGFGLPNAARLAGGIEENFRRRVDVLPDQTRNLLVIAAAEPLGDPALVWRAAARLGIGGEAAAPAVEAGLVDFDARVRFRHPLVRSAVYGSASVQERQRVHSALAQVTDPQHDPDRRAWHQGHAATGPDEVVAAELERSAGRARARGGVAAAAAFLERASMLTLDPVQRADRALAAASAKVKAGAFDAARDLLSIAETMHLNDFQHARLEMVGAELALVTSRGSDAPPLLLKAARRLEPIDAELSRATYLQALSAGYFAGRLALGGGVREVARAARALPPPQHAPRPPDLLLDGLVAHYTEGYAAGLPLLRRGIHAYGTGMTPDEELRWHWVAGIIARHVWDDDSWHVLSERHVQLARGVGALSELPVALSSRAFMLLFAGELTAAEWLIQELQPAIQATVSNRTPYVALGIAALAGRRAEAVALIDVITREVTLRGEGIGISVVEWAEALLNNGLGDYQKALRAAESCIDYVGEMISPPWPAVELIEAAARSGRSDIAAEAYRRLAEITGASGTNWARGVEARSRALLSDGDAAEHLYRESIERLGRTRIRVDLARAHLLYGEWLRRKRRRIDARAQLRIAHEMLDAMGMEAFAERARRELKATGETARKRSSTTGSQELTAQEAQIARMARDGLSNPEIGARLFISVRTVQYHLNKVFTKLGIASRTQLDRVLPDGPADI
ncbi:helix-turn-helix transcriptional regulator [Mycobacterium sp.]|jgi:DNA-binding CsgD family transcriptional regulator|uniref:helix-turn-helix transcriptional regulator n=1 Tax=Mycobacterium sp. TaxID=1785 RepID=UPI002D65C8BA|nr:AAA family ATPase [Mycobacterium sp.]HZA12690.1 AAA family ATPase [Mycobacterium sp.]